MCLGRGRGQEEGDLAGKVYTFKFGVYDNNRWCYKVHWMNGWISGWGDVYRAPTVLKKETSYEL